MATIVLSAVGASIGAGFGGTVLGLSGAVIGRAVGAVLGQSIDQRLLGLGSERVESGRIDRFHLTGASEGVAVGQVYGAVRVGGQVIWATRFAETKTVSGGGKGAPRPTVTAYSYSVSLAIALCEGEILRVGRVWADGVEVARDDLPMRVYTGSEEQLPDPKIEAVEGAGMAPAYRGIAYVVFEDLGLAPYGNRVPQFSFEVLRPAQGPRVDETPELIEAVQAVALIPGTGEYALATTPVHFSDGPGVNISANINSPSGKTDFATSLEMLTAELPACRSVSLVVSWFGDDLRCGSCSVRPQVEAAREGVGMAWRSGGITRAEAQAVAQVDGRPVYGGTPADASVVEAIQALKAAGQEVMFYPFLLMEQLAGNGLADPYGGAEQPALPWRGRITLDVAPGRDGSTDGTAAAEAEVAAFFGTAAAADFSVVDGVISYAGPDEWSYRRFILHCAHLAALAGGVDAFCVGSEMRGLTRIRGASGYPAVAALRALAAEVRGILGADTRISYAADWSEYGAYQHPGGDLLFPLDALWADDNVDFIGIDNYMPLSDWRDGNSHADASWGAIYNLDYLRANVAGGKDYDWYYQTEAAAELQRRTPITDGAHGEPWVYRVKDIRGWWENTHHERIGGVRQVAATGWVPQAKPIVFTEIGCPAIDKGTNQPNVFLDPKSSESALPYFSLGTRDDMIQRQYLRALISYWRDGANNPVSEVYGAPMVDIARAHVWAWDARPFPFFPNNSTLWTDGDNYAHGHWITGRATAQDLARVVAEICGRSGVESLDLSRLFGVVRGYAIDRVEEARAALQPLMLTYGIDAVEREGVLRFQGRDGYADAAVDVGRLVLEAGADSALQTVRAAAAEVAGRVRLNFVEAEGEYRTRAAETVFPGDPVQPASQSELPLVLTLAEGRKAVERWLAESRVARDTARFALPPSELALGAGDVVALAGESYRIDRVEQAGAQSIEAVRVEPGPYQPSDAVEERAVPRAFVAPVPVFPQFLDLPLLRGDEVPYAPHVAATATPWPGSVAVYSSTQDAGYALNTLLPAGAVIGLTQTALLRAAPGLWDRGPALRVKVYGGTLASVSQAEVLNGANAVAIGDGSSGNWEVIQFAGAVLVAPDTYDLSLRLRGQAGSDGLMPDVWPEGSLFVALDGAPRQIALAASARGLARHYRIGPAGRAYDDPSYVHLVEAFEGIGLRPYAPCHLAADVAADGALAVSWIRRTRIDGDSWQSVEVPLGEAREAYLVRVVSGGGVVREEEVSAPAWSYPAAAQAADGVVAPYEIRVAQVSDSFGPGLFAALAVA
ncbi:baseplate multidomain protein megatron [Acidimangrovimonas pyrenivorans]|uniref:Glycoside hydrolase TIM-barrel-like domain-containing protein n=1 Tax=Acidimangrovimonas pyrenivorans TaxID=2030798 RepID=A0ABV7AFR5_9RHOB